MYKYFPCGMPGDEFYVSSGSHSTDVSVGRCARARGC